MRHASSAILLAASALLSPSAPADEPASAELPWASASDYETRTLEGWTVFIHPDLSRGEPELCDRTLELLRIQLFQITRVVPKPAVEKLRAVRIWVELAHPRHPCMCYHVSPDWLRSHHMNPEKAGCVELSNARNFLSWTIQQPWMVLHELAHAYHDQFLPDGHANPDVAAAFRAAQNAKKYAEVLRINGRRERHYAATNPMEYFAESTEAYFGTNDFYPFVKSELKEHDPQMFNLLGKLWAGETTAAAAPRVSSAPPLAASGDPELVSVKKIWDAGRHNAFTDLLRWRDRFWCTFREADDHVGGDGTIRLLSSKDGDAWESAALIAEDGIDLRDPKLSVTPDDRLMIVAGGSVYRGTKTLMGRQPRVMFSINGAEWTKPERVLAEGDWLWRVTWHEGTAYGVAYRTEPRPGGNGDRASDWLATLYSSRDGRAWKLVTDLEVPDRPNETTLRFLDDGTMLALVRREKGDTLGWIGQAKPPYAKWNWTPTKHRLGGPNFLVLPNGQLWAGSRRYPGGAKTVLARMTAETYEPILTLPSGGDTSYPGFVWHDGLLWMSYYSSHEGRTSIYLAKLRLPAPQ